ncbi:MAG: YciI family protein [Alphaproteobacteria bacterium]|jgi:uncharacterized protein|nr:YciI family protein [Alphaproteobacteria bacterium]MBU1551466.1 YciI family protein [Alphaproteobacteria bacterium]MBU2334698.1 YciI family protein [Alphaproteobacteria bacterium]MBU2386420.1 YciI family protein [Alphaproteobacteria bacterium]|tara:strand:- start:196 stop:516 length:321 start_codon:yes stop_codon:yes gene_type:complete
MRHFILFYELAADYAERRDLFRDTHLRHTWAASDRGELVLAGSLTNPRDSNMLLFQGEEPDAAEAFAREDPYVLNGIVTSWCVREWLTAVGKDASSPVHPTGASGT